MDQRRASGSVKSRNLTITRYDAGKQLYTFDGFNNSGEHKTATQTCEGNSCIATGSFQLDNKTIKTRFTVREVSPELYEYGFEISEMVAQPGRE